MKMQRNNQKISGEDESALKLILFDAVKRNDSKSLQDLLPRVSDKNARDSEGRTILIFATVHGSTEVMKLLLDNGADVNGRDSYGRTAIMYAASNGYNYRARMLIDYEANVNAIDNKGRTALKYALMNGHTAATGLLSRNGAVLRMGIGEINDAIGYIVNHDRSILTAALKKVIRTKEPEDMVKYM